jgi:hypothetical protein
MCRSSGSCYSKQLSTASNLQKIEQVRTESHCEPPPALLSPGYQHSKEDMEHSPRSVLYAQGLCVENNMLVDYAISTLEAVPHKCSMPKGSSLPHHSVLRVPVQGLKLNNPATQVNLYFLLRIEQYIFLVNRKIVISSNIPSEARM